jgi:hypothetical protein
MVPVNKLLMFISLTFTLRECNGLLQLNTCNFL